MSVSAVSDVAEIFRLLGQPVRIQILLAIGADAACVCHLEAVLHLRQAAISQHLMALRQAGLVTSERDGRFIFYRLADGGLLDAILRMAVLSGLSREPLENLGRKPVAGCPCPYCNPGLGPTLTCSSEKHE